MDLIRPPYPRSVNRAHGSSEYIADTCDMSILTPREMDMRPGFLNQALASCAEAAFCFRCSNKEKQGLFEKNYGSSFPSKNNMVYLRHVLASSLPRA